jgi:hypothetical protein
MCDECKKLQKQLCAANSYYCHLVEKLGELVHAAGLSKKSVANMDPIAIVKEVTKAFKNAVQKRAVKEASKQDAVAMNEAFEELPEVWQENLEWLQETTLEPRDIDRMVELFDLLGYSRQRLQFMLTSGDMALALKRC